MIYCLLFIYIYEIFIIITILQFLYYYFTILFQNFFVNYKIKVFLEKLIIPDSIRNIYQ